ncbi:MULTISPECIES: mycothiol synthase [unclassified Rathayibacter]|uniref:mycothiol synthase n=1 Tax=unclassified Rathayibacter TaxID=2609250 RepID=UPI00188D565B|nr:MULTISPECIES: mycothiol synthase [unclassified Rathayibacter]MBF4461707.1 mycothiol synthase [Rathayibacter sp. VKM Ac-2879]MBF4503118.1 mycothiol synthase [Rathayibacter sp. VKM Ac-2878]
MSESLNLSVEDLADPTVSAGLDHLIGRASWFDGQPPFSDQTLVEARTGSRTLLVGLRADVVVAAAVLGQGELEFVVDPEWRGVGFGRAALEQVLASGRTGLLAWSHGDHPAARSLAASHGFSPVRTLLRLALDPLMPVEPLVPDGFTLTDARGLDAAEWVALNARIFAAHPEQGRMTEADLAARQTEPWFDEGDFLLVRDARGTLVGYDWLKIEPGATTGEIYVLGVAPEAAGRGLGRALLTVGLARMLDRGCTAADLYVEAENRAAVRLYRSLGFVDASADVQYLQRAPSVR